MKFYLDSEVIMFSLSGDVSAGITYFGICLDCRVFTVIGLKFTADGLRTLMYKPAVADIGPGALLLTVCLAITFFKKKLARACIHILILQLFHEMAM